MDLDHWKRIEKVYYSVLASPLTQRIAVLDDLCSDDEGVKREVESLLDARERAGNFLSAGNFQNHVGDLFGGQDQVGRTLGRYQILSPIGAGAMGEVYLARDAGLDRQVALKILPAAFMQDAGRVMRFQREAKAVSALNHPNIMTIYEIGEVDGTWFIATEFIEGTTLRRRLSSGRLELPEVLAIALQCAHALQAAHQVGIVHRDIKPENIMIRPDGLVKVVDFGLARMSPSGSELSADATQSGALIGTPRYMSPEQARGEKLDARTDVFSLGAVVYEMTTGHPAFPGATTADVFAALLSSQCPPPSKFASGLPERVDAIALKALERDREARYQSMQDFATDLQEALQFPDTSRAKAKARRESPQPVRRASLSAWQAIMAAVVLAVIAATVFYVRAGRSGGHPDAPPLSVLPLTSFEGFKDFGSFSPDGKRVAFSWNGGEGGSGGKPERNIYLLTIGQEDATRLTFGTEDERSPAWSPDGRNIAFCRAVFTEPTPSKYGVYILPASGGQERKIVEAGLGVSWSPDNKFLAIAGLVGGTSGISLISLSGNLRKELTNPRPYVDTLPVFSPDGKWIAFTRDFGFSAREIFVVRAGGGRPKQLTFDRQPTYGATWTPDGREIIFASNRGVGGESLWRIPASGGRPRRLSATLRGGFYPSISPVGRQLVYTESAKDTNIYAFEGAGFQNRSAPALFGQQRRLIVSSRRDDSPNISPDGKRIAFVSTRTGNEEIWISDADRRELKQLTSFKGQNTGTPRWSPDGRQIAFDSSEAGNPNIYVMDGAGGTPRRLTSGPWGNFMPSWSPDGKWIYFKSERSGSDQIWKIPSSGGSPIQVTRGGACEAFASPDGKRLYFTKRAWAPIWTVPVDGGPEEPVPELEHFDKIFRSWGIVQQGIYFLSRENRPTQTVHFFSFARRQVSALATIDRQPIWDYPDLALSADGRQLVYASLDQEFNDLMLIENFH